MSITVQPSSAVHRLPVPGRAIQTIPSYSMEQIYPCRCRTLDMPIWSRHQTGHGGAWHWVSGCRDSTSAIFSLVCSAQTLFSSFGASDNPTQVAKPSSFLSHGPLGGQFSTMASRSASTSQASSKTNHRSPHTSTTSLLRLSTTPFTMCEPRTKYSLPSLHALGTSAFKETPMPQVTGITLPSCYASRQATRRHLRQSWSLCPETI